MPYLQPASSLLTPEIDCYWPLLLLAQLKQGHVLPPPPSSSTDPGIPCLTRRHTDGKREELNVHTWRGERVEGWLPHLSGDATSTGRGRSYQQAAVAVKYRQAVTLIAHLNLPGTAVSIIVGSSRLFVMLKRAV